MKSWKRRIQYAPIIIALMIVTVVVTCYFCLDVEQKVILKAENVVYPLGITDVSCTLYNASLQLVRYYLSFSLERLADGEWESVDDVMLDFGDSWLGGKLQAFSSRQLTLHVGYYSYFSEPFDYRIKMHITTENYLDMIKRDYFDTEHTIYCYFSVR